MSSPSPTATPSAPVPCSRLEGPEQYLDIALSLTAFIDSWAWAMASTDEGANLEPEAFQGLGRLARHVHTLLEHCQTALDATRRTGPRSESPRQ